MVIKEYNRNNAVEYAKTWALKRNSKYYDYDKLGGDCTNYISQCIYNGCKTMNYNQYGWYYSTANNKSASWTGVDYFHKFLTTNKSVGPYGKLCSLDDIDIGDVIQISFEPQKYAHTVIVISKENNTLDGIHIAAHSFDVLDKVLSSYEYIDMRCIKIEGYRTWK